MKGSVKHVNSVLLFVRQETFLALLNDISCKQSGLNNPVAVIPAKPPFGHKFKGTHCFQQKCNSLLRKIRVPEPEMKIQEPKTLKTYKIVSLFRKQTCETNSESSGFSRVSYSCIPGMSKRVYYHILWMSTLSADPCIGKDRSLSHLFSHLM